MEKKIITISREFGSGGRSIGRMVAEKLGIPFYDKELVEQIALESGFAPKFVEENGEHAPGFPADGKWVVRCENIKGWSHPGTRCGSSPDLENR